MTAATNAEDSLFLLSHKAVVPSSFSAQESCWYCDSAAVPVGFRSHGEDPVTSEWKVLASAKTNGDRIILLSYAAAETQTAWNTAMASKAQPPVDYPNEHP